MNKREQLLADALGDNPGAEFARLAAVQVRRRRVARQLVAGAGVACLLVAGAVLSRPRPPGPGSELVMRPATPAVEIMSDQELLALLKDQPVLILKNDNRVTGVVFLNSGTKL